MTEACLQRLTSSPTSLSTGVAVAVTGKWSASKGQEQSHELQVDSIRVLGDNDAAVSTPHAL